MDTKQSSANPRAQHPAGDRDRAVRDSTRAVTADRALCGQIAAVLFTDPEPIERAFLGEPVLEVMGMFVWALDHDHEPDFNPARTLPAWAKKRGRGAYRQPQPTPAERTWSGNSSEQDAEIEEAVETGGQRRRSLPAGKWGRFSPEQVQANLARMEQG